MIKRGGKNRKAQINLSFGMIFSIILIVVFIAFAFYAIGKFLDLQKSAKTGQFISAFEEDIDRMWRSSQGSQEIEYSLPTSVDYLCFADFGREKEGIRKDFYNNLRLVHFEDENIFFYPVGSSGGVNSAEIDNIDIAGITGRENPYCIRNIKGKVKLTIKKGFDEGLVTIAR